MITEILVEGTRLDLSEDIGAELNYAIDDIKDFASRNTNYSKTITLPGNANNNKVFGHIYNFTSANNYVPTTTGTNVGYNFDPTRQANCKIFVNKIQVFKGVIRLLEIKISKGTIEYECAVFGELGGFASAIGNSLLEDMDNFNAYDQAWTYANISSSWDASAGTSIVYPLIDYGLVKHSNVHDYHISAFRPAFFVAEFMYGIVANSGYTVESEFFKTDFFKSLIIPNNKGVLEQVKSNLLSVGTQTTITMATEPSSLTFNLINSVVLFTNSLNQVFTFTGANGTLGNITFSGGFYLTRLGSAKISVYQNASVIYEETFTNGYNYQLFNIDWLIETSLDTNDTLSVYVDLTSSDSAMEFEPDFGFNFISSYAQATSADVGDTLTMKYLIPKGIQQKDFFSSICRMFNLYVFEDVNRPKHLLIEPYIEFYRTGAGFLKINDLGELLLHGETGDPTGLLLLSDPVADSIDWTNKVDYSKEISIKPMGELNARYFDFLYTEDSDYYNEKYQNKYNESYGDRKEDTGYQFAEDRQETKLIFSPSILVARTGDDKLCASIFELDGNTEKPIDHNIRIMQFKKVPATSWAMKNVTGNANVQSGILYYGYAGHLDDPILPTSDINFGAVNEVYFKLTNPYPNANLFTAFWGDYIAEIIHKDSKLLSCYLYLTVQDIYSLDFAQLIYIDGALWRLNKIIDFNPSANQTTKVELLRVIELTYA